MIQGPTTNIEPKHKYSENAQMVLCVATKQYVVSCPKRPWALSTALVIRTVPSGTPVRVRWSAEVLRALLFGCLLDVCLHDDDNPIKAISLESP